MRDDARTGCTQSFVGAGLIPVPVCVEQRVHRRLACQLAHGLQHAGRLFRRAAIDQQYPCSGIKHHYVAAAAADQRQSGRERSDLQAYFGSASR